MAQETPRDKITGVRSAIYPIKHGIGYMARET